MYELKDRQGNTVAVLKRPPTSEMLLRSLMSEKREQVAVLRRIERQLRLLNAKLSRKRTEDTPPVDLMSGPSD